MSKKNICFLYRLLVIVSLSAGILLNILKVKKVSRILSYYTLQINIFCLIIFIIFEVADILKIKCTNSIYYLIKGEAIVSMLLMVIVYTISLSPKNFQMYYNRQSNIANILVHFISPILVVLDYVIFDEKGNFKRIYPIIWVFIPAIYVVYVYSYSSSGGRFYNIGGSKKFAYVFLDYEQYGLKVALWIALIGLVTILIGYILFRIDLKLAKKKKRVKE